MYIGNISRLAELQSRIETFLKGNISFIGVGELEWRGERERERPDGDVNGCCL
uniref:Uncharacterized protein n=1 Tax=Nelumbo nucifera TaxID=4432 RepID=A0A822ZDX3_NELNU|nr:TPA_asm: hypothetical protein HUJ06_001317 [Nelumbo nucifera]